MSDAETLDRPGAALAVIPKSQLPTLLAADSDDILGRLAAKVAKFVPDISTAKGRAEIKSLAAEVASTKMELIRMGKGLTEDWRQKTKAVNAECNLLEERMDALKAKVRGPLTEWENQEKARVDGLEKAIADIIGLAANLQPDAASTEIGMLLEALPGLSARKWDEFADRASRVVAEVGDRLRAAHARAVQREDEAAELARLRAAETERQRVAAHRDALKSIAAVADIETGTGDDGQVTSFDLAVRIDLLKRRHSYDWQEFAQEADDLRAATIDELERRRRVILGQEAEAKARREQEIAEAAAAAARAEAERLAAEQAAAAEAAATAERERMRRQAEADAAAAAEREAASARAAAEATARAEQAERNRQASEAAAAQREQEAAAKAQREQEAAVAAERRRQEQQAAADRAAADKRAADKAHRTRINREALQDLCGAADITSEVGQAVIAAIARGTVRHLSVTY